MNASHLAVPSATGVFPSHLTERNDLVTIPTRGMNEIDVCNDGKLTCVRPNSTDRTPSRSHIEAQKQRDLDLDVEDTDFLASWNCRIINT